MEFKIGNEVIIRTSSKEVIGHEGKIVAVDSSEGWKKYVVLYRDSLGGVHTIFCRKENLELAESDFCKAITDAENTLANLHSKSKNSIKDSGDRTTYPSGAIRDKRTGKGMYSLIPVYALERLARHYEAGRAKYSDENNHELSEENWRKGMFLLDFFDSDTRHGESWRKGDYSEDHLAAKLWNTISLMETERRIELGILPTSLDNRDVNEFEEPRDLYKNLTIEK